MTSPAKRFSGPKVVQLRNARGITQAELARRTHFHQSQLSRYERAGKKGGQVPGADVVGILAAALECSIDDLYVDGGAGSSDEDEEADLFSAAHALDRAGEYELADVLRRRARDAARASGQSRVVS